MAAITIATNDVAEITSRRVSIIQGPTAEDVTAGQYVRLDSNGQIALGNATSSSEVGYGGIAVDNGDNGRTIVAVREGVINLGSALSSLAFGAKVYLGTADGQLVDTTPEANEVVQILMDGTAGSWAVIFGGGTSAAMAFNAAETVVQDALNGLSTIGPGNAIANLPAAGTYTITFVGELADYNVGAITIDETSLTGGTTTVSVSTAGVHAVEIGTVISVFGNGATADKLLAVNVREVPYG